MVKTNDLSKGYVYCDNKMAGLSCILLELNNFALPTNLNSSTFTIHYKNMPGVFISIILCLKGDPVFCNNNTDYAMNIKLEQ